MPHYQQQTTSQQDILQPLGGLTATSMTIAKCGQLIFMNELELRSYQPTANLVLFGRVDMAYSTDMKTERVALENENGGIGEVSPQCGKRDSTFKLAD